MQSYDGVSLTESQNRNIREEAFHNEWAESLDAANVPVDAAWTAATCPEHRWIRERLGELRGKRILDLGCGAGEGAVWFAKQGAEVVACDLSPKFLELVQALASVHSTTLVTHVADADSIGLDADSFDIVYAGNLLHHVDIARTLDQIYYVLKPGGILVSWDPLKHNPLIKIYRRMATEVRTIDEHPLSVAQLSEFRKRFSNVQYDCFWFCTLWIFMRFFLIERVHPSKERYWKKIIHEHERLTPIFNRLDRVDRWLFRKVPYLKRFGWTIAVYAVKAG